jgi:hypothetical protein
MVAVINIGIIFYDAFEPGKPTSLALAMTIIVVASSMLIIFTVVGSILIHRLGLFFKSNYDKQRISLLTALLLIIFSLLVLTVRYGMEYAYLNDRKHGANSHEHVPLWLLIAFLIVSDFGPLVAQMYCMWLAKKGNWDDLISGFLEPPIKEETTDPQAGSSTILGKLKQETSFKRFRSELLESECDWGSDHPDFIGTSLLSRSSFDLASSLKRCTAHNERASDIISFDALQILE